MKKTKSMKSITWNEYANVALAKWYEVDGLTSRTVGSQRAILEYYILPIIGNDPVYLIDNSNTNLKILLRRIIKVPSFKTRRNRMGVLRRLLKTAIKDGFLQKIPSTVNRISIPNEYC